MTRRDQDNSGRSSLRMFFDLWIEMSYSSLKLMKEASLELASATLAMLAGTVAVFELFGQSVIMTSDIVVSSIMGVSSITVIIVTWRTHLRSRLLSRTKQQYPKLSIVGIMRLRKANQTQWALILLLLSSIAYVGLSMWIDYALDKFIVAILALLIILLAIGQIIFDYRVRHGLYGNNEREAREIISFITQESSDIDFTNRGKLKKIISDEDLKKIEQTAIEAMPRTAF